MRRFLACDDVPIGISEGVGRCQGVGAGRTSWLLLCERAWTRLRGWYRLSGCRTMFGLSVCSSLPRHSFADRERASVVRSGHDSAGSSS